MGFFGGKKARSMLAENKMNRMRCLWKFFVAEEFGGW